MIYLNGERISPTIFPDNTSQVWKLDETDLNLKRGLIQWDFSHEGEIMHVAQLKYLLDSYGARSWLHLDYLPYGRQDKPVSNTSTFALHTFAHIINKLHFIEVVIMDPHSEEALALINRSSAVYPHGPLSRAIADTCSTLVCYPDNGALTKYTKVYATTPYFIYGEKVRDPLTGYISNYTLHGDPAGHKVMIVDDICDGGKTFELLSNDLLKAGAEEVNLFVTHGLFTKGLRPLHDAGIKRIFTNKGEAITVEDGGFGFKQISRSLQHSL